MQRHDKLSIKSCDWLTGAVVGQLLDNIVPILCANLHPDKDAEVRSKFFTLLSRLIVTADTTLNSDNRCRSN